MVYRHFFNVLYLHSYTYLTCVHTIVWLMVLDNLVSDCGHPVHASMKITLNCDAVAITSLEGHSK